MEAKGYITLGPKTAYQYCIAIYYTPTDEQIKNLQEMFGWDFVTPEEQKELYGG
jgi:hypothetical protein